MAADPPQALPEPVAGFDLAVSISDSPDLARLGLTDTHLRMALGEVARAVLVADGNLSYGGHLRDDGYTSFLIHECEKHGRRDRPFTGYVPWPVHRALTTDELVGHTQAVGTLGRYVFLGPQGEPLDDPTADRPEDAHPVAAAVRIRALTAMREHWTGLIDGRLVAGGPREGYQGRAPGIIEETILTIQAGKPLFVAGGFGGAAGDIAAALGLDPENWLGLPDRSARPDIAELVEVAAAAGWDPTGNGLTLQQNRQLAISYRASEIASLAVLGITQLRGSR